MGLGKANHPGPGFFSFFSGLGLGALAVVVLLRNRFSRDTAENAPRKAIPWKPFLLTCTCLIGYILVIDTLGFTLTTFLFIGTLLRTVGKRSWALSSSLGLGIALGAYLLFGFLLQSNLPQGPFGFMGL
jgi:putative tricarboxylic transport membrane protein